MGARTPNQALRRMVEAAGCSYEALARAVVTVAAENGERARTDRTSIAHWINGTTPRGRAGLWLVEALSRKLGRTVTLAQVGLASGNELPAALDSADPIGSVIDLGSAELADDVNRRRMLAGAAYSVAALALPAGYDPGAAERGARARARGGMVGDGEVATVRALTKAFAAADERAGGGHARTAVVQYLTTDAAAMCSGRFRTAAHRRAIFGAAAELAHLAGWMAHDLQREGLAQRYYLTAYRLASASDQHAHAAWELRLLSHQASGLGHGPASIDLAQEALRRVAGRVDAHTQAMFTATLARAYSADRHTRAATTTIAAAERLLDAEAAPEEMPHFAMLGPASSLVAHHAADIAAAAGEHRSAEAAFRATLASRDPIAYRRVHALTLVDLAGLLADTGRADEAVATWDQALDYMAGVQSGRHRKAMVAMRAHLAGFKRRGIPGSTDLDRRAADLLSTMA